MPADLTADALIELLMEHRSASYMLGLSFSSTADERELVWRGVARILLASTTEGDAFEDARCWLTGASIRKCDELSINVDREADGYRWVRFTAQLETWHGLPKVTRGTDAHPTRLHAAIAALESYAKEAPIAQ